MGGEYLKLEYDKSFLPLNLWNKTKQRFLSHKHEQVHAHTQPIALYTDLIDIWC